MEVPEEGSKETDSGPESGAEPAEADVSAEIPDETMAEASADADVSAEVPDETMAEASADALASLSSSFVSTRAPATK